MIGKCLLPGAITLCAITLWAAMLRAEDEKLPGPFNSDFEKVDKIPEELLMMNGVFELRAENGNKFLEIPGEPLDTFVLMFGPDGAMEVGARLRGASTGKRTPEMGVGLAGPAGFRLWLMPAVRELQIVKGDEVKASIPYHWTSGKWTMFRLKIEKTGEKSWKVSGKAWEEGKAEPEKAMVSMETTAELIKGRATVWVIPYSGKAMQVDDVGAK